MKKKQAIKLSLPAAVGWPEWVIFALFVVSFVIVSVSHEPWFDEAESWQIAKCASVREILLVLPHYEGHPPLWHLLLVLPAKLGVPYELGLKTVAAIPTLLAVWLLLFRSPFPRPVRMLLPFHYFVFYQYGVVSRPYGLMLLAAILAAMSFGARDEKPWRFVLSLLFLCLCSAYGILLAGGICICWVLDILKESGRKCPKTLWKDRRVYALAALLIAALVLIAEIMPYPDTYAMTLENATPLPLRLIYTLFMMLPDCLLTNTFTGIRSLLSLNLSASVYIVVGLLGAAMWVVIYLLLEPKNRKYYFIPAILLSAFMSLLYAHSHHIGTIAILLLLVLWGNGKPSDAIKSLVERAKLSERDQNALKILKGCFAGLVLLIPVYWTVGASAYDLQYPYFHSRATAEFLEESGLLGKKIMSQFVIHVPEALEEENLEGSELLPYIDPLIQYRAMDTSAYFSKNYFYTLNNQDDDLAYVIHRETSIEETEAIIAHWREMGAPDVLLGKVDLKTVFGDTVTLDDYAPVYQMVSTSVAIWKADFLGEELHNYNYVYLRKDLLDDYGLTPLEVDEILYG